MTRALRDEDHGGTTGWAAQGVEPLRVGPCSGGRRPGMKSIVIGIPTFNRQALLTRLLDSLIEEVRSEPAVLRIVVADNECSDRTREIVLGRQDMPTHYVPVPERGLSHVRNAIIRAAGEQVPDWDWLVMLDDDGMVTPG